MGHDSTVTASAFACQKQDDTESTAVAVTGDFNGGLRLWDYKEAAELTASEKCENEDDEGVLPPSISKRRRLGNDLVVVSFCFWLVLLLHVTYITSQMR